MKTMKKLFLTVMMCGLLGTGLVHANEQGEKEHGLKGKGMAKIFDQLNLTEDQKKALEANKNGKREEMKASFEKMKSLRQEMKQELMKPTVDENKVNAINAQIKANQAQMADRRLQSILEVRKILTPEQFAKFSTLMEERREKWMKKEGHESHSGPDSE